MPLSIVSFTAANKWFKFIYSSICFAFCCHFTLLLLLLQQHSHAAHSLSRSYFCTELKLSLLGVCGAAHAFCSFLYCNTLSCMHSRIMETGTEDSLRIFIPLPLVDVMESNFKHDLCFHQCNQDHQVPTEDSTIVATYLEMHHNCLSNISKFHHVDVTV